MIESDTPPGQSIQTKDQAEPDLPLKSLVEGLLFVADEPVLIDRIATITETTIAQVEQILDELASEYQDGYRGLRLQFKRGRVQMVSAPDAAGTIRRFLDLELTSKLSHAALEALAIVAYRQPVTRAEVDRVRGVNSDSVLRTLVNRGLIEELGRLEQAGRPSIFGTTFEFLQQFGLTSLDQLPPLEIDAATS
jgi:segregation and condensation protein B